MSSRRSRRLSGSWSSAATPGDNVVLISYGATVRAQPTALIYDEQDKAAIHRQINELKAEGDWTYTAAAIPKGLAEAKRLDDAQGANKHQQAHKAGDLAH